MSDAIEAIKNGTAHVVTMTRDEAEEVWSSIQEDNEKAEELANAFDNAKNEGGKAYILVEIAG